MPISNERVPNKPLAGHELVKIIEKDVHEILNRDGMFNSNIAYGRVSYEVRVSLHMDNPVYPEHISTVLSRKASKQMIEAAPELESVETPPLQDSSDGSAVFSEEIHRNIASPNMARVEHGLPLTIDKKNLDTGHIESKEVKYTGDIPDPESVGNTRTDKNTEDDQRNKWNKPKGGKR